MQYECDYELECSCDKSELDTETEWVWDSEIESYICEDCGDTQ